MFLKHILFSAPELKTLSIIRPSVSHPSLLTFHIFDFYSKAVEENLTKLDRKQELNNLYQVFVFLADQKTEMTAMASDWLWH